MAMFGLSTRGFLAEDGHTDRDLGGSGGRMVD